MLLIFISEEGSLRKMVIFFLLMQKDCVCVCVFGVGGGRERNVFI